MKIQLTQILFQIINFSVVVGALSYLLYNPILKVLDERKKKIEAAQKKAEEIETEKANLDKTIQTTQREAEKKAAQILDEAREAAQAQSKKSLAEAKKKAQKEIETLKANWADEKAAEMKSMKKDFSDAVMNVTQKVLGKSLDSKAQTKLIDEELDKLLKSI